MTGLRGQLAAWLERPTVQRMIIGVIIFNAILLGMETSELIMARAGLLVTLLDRVCLGIFAAEILVKLYTYRGRFFRDGWNVADFIIVAVSLMPGANTLSVLRALRILRALRLVSTVPSLRRVMEGLIGALPGMASVLGLTGLIFYVGSVITTKLFGGDFPEWFGTIGRSAYSLFQIMTLESWSMGIVRVVMADYPYAWAFFVPFIIVTTFAVMNLVVGLIVNAMQQSHYEEQSGATDIYRDEVLRRLAAIESRLADLDGRDGRD